MRPGFGSRQSMLRASGGRWGVSRWRIGLRKGSRRAPRVRSLRRRYRSSLRETPGGGFGGRGSRGRCRRCSGCRRRGSAPRRGVVPQAMAPCRSWREARKPPAAPQRRFSPVKKAFSPVWARAIVLRVRRDFDTPEAATIGDQPFHPCSCTFSVRWQSPAPGGPRQPSSARPRCQRGGR